MIRLLWSKKKAVVGQMILIAWLWIDDVAITWPLSMPYCWIENDQSFCSWAQAMVDNRQVSTHRWTRDSFRKTERQKGIHAKWPNGKWQKDKETLGQSLSVCLSLGDICLTSLESWSCWVSRASVTQNRGSQTCYDKIVTTLKWLLVYYWGSQVMATLRWANQSNHSTLNDSSMNARLYVL